MFEAIIIWPVINFVVGVALGLAIFFIARHKQANTYGWSALLLCSLAGLLVGAIGSVPIAIVLGGIAIACSPERLKSLGEKKPEDPKDVAIAVAFILLAVAMLVVLAFQVDALG